MPFHCGDDREKTSLRWAQETLDELFSIASIRNTTKQSSPPEDEHPLVEILPAIYLKRDHGGPTVEDFTKNKYDFKAGGSTITTRLPEWTRIDSRLQFQHLTIEMLDWQNQVFQLRIPPLHELHAAGYLYAWFFQTPVVNAPKMLEHMLSQIEKDEKANVDVETGMVYESVDHMIDTARELDCNAVVNCTGLGSQHVLSDSELVGARGILHYYDRENCPRRPEISQMLRHDAIIMTEDAPWGTDTMPCYMIPRGKDIAVGGSYIEHDTETEVREHETKRLLSNAALLGIDIEKTKPKSTWTGFRPFRSKIRCELDQAIASQPQRAVKVVHNYGFGGSGWTINVGAAKECTRILLREFSKA